MTDEMRMDEEEERLVREMKAALISELRKARTMAALIRQPDGSVRVVTPYGYLEIRDAELAAEIENVMG
jgi:hypothetical protein